MADERRTRRDFLGDAAVFLTAAVPGWKLLTSCTSAPQLRPAPPAHCLDGSVEQALAILNSAGSDATDAEILYELLSLEALQGQRLRGSYSEDEGNTTVRYSLGFPSTSPRVLCLKTGREPLLELTTHAHGSSIGMAEVVYNVEDNAPAYGEIQQPKSVANQIVRYPSGDCDPAIEQVGVLSVGASDLFQKQAIGEYARGALAEIVIAERTKYERMAAGCKELAAPVPVQR